MTVPRSIPLARVFCVLLLAYFVPQVPAQDDPAEIEMSSPAEAVPAEPEAQADGAAAAAADDPASAAPAGAIDLSKLQSEKLRDPFWPVNYEPPPPEPKTPTGPTGVKKPTTPTPVIEEAPRWDEALKTMVVKGVMKIAGGKYVAMIAGKVVGEGETVCTEYRGRKYCWKIGAVSERGVSFQRLGLDE